MKPFVKKQEAVMKKTAIFLAPGFEEGEALTVADILRRAGIGCELVGFRRWWEGPTR